MQTLDTSEVRMSGGAQRRDVDFPKYMHARQAGLLRAAYLLNGDLHSAEDLVQTSLAELYVSWDKVRDWALDGYVRRIVNENNSLWRRAWKNREFVTETMPEQHFIDEFDGGAHGPLWALVQTLPRKACAVGVLRSYEQLSEAETAEILGITVETVKSQASRALATLREGASELNPRHNEEER